MQIQAYLFFNGHTEEAVDFYRRALGAELEMLMRFKDAPDPPPPGMVPDGWGDKVMHASITVGDQRIMLSDGCDPAAAGHQGFALAVSVPDVASADRVFAALGEGGSVTMPQSATFWSPSFGMLTDRYGVGWMVMVATDDATTAPT